MLEALRKKLAALLEQRSAAQKSLDEILDATATEERSELTTDEQSKFAEARSVLDAVDDPESEDAIPFVEKRIADLEQLNERRVHAEGVSVPVREGAPEIRVNEAQDNLVYRANGENDFFRDAMHAHQGDWEAQHRLSDHKRQMATQYETRAADGTTGAFGTLVVPGYLTDLYAPILRSGRPWLNAITNLDLPDEGMSLYVPLGNTATAVAAQATQNSAAQNTTFGESDLTIPVNTYSGQQVVSRQAVDRGRNIANILMQDLMAAYTTTVNVDCLTGAGSGGTHTGVLSNTGLTTIGITATTASAVYSKIQDGIQRVNSNRYLPATAIVMHPRRWGQFCVASDSNGRPLVEISAGSGNNVLGSGRSAAYGQIVGSMAGVPVITDAGLGTAQNGTWVTDSIIVTKADDVLFWEQPGAPMEVRLEEVLANQLSIRFVLWGYSAFTSSRYTQATYVISGTGLVAPTF